MLQWNVPEILHCNILVMPQWNLSIKQESLNKTWMFK